MVRFIDGEGASKAEIKPEPEEQPFIYTHRSKESHDEETHKSKKR